MVIATGETIATGLVDTAEKLETSPHRTIGELVVSYYTGSLATKRPISAGGGIACSRERTGLIDTSLVEAAGYIPKHSQAHIVDELVFNPAECWWCAWRIRQ